VVAAAVPSGGAFLALCLTFRRRDSGGYLKYPAICGWKASSAFSVFMQKNRAALDSPCSADSLDLLIQNKFAFLCPKNPRKSSRKKNAVPF
jgi:hypothetical protein